MEMQRPDPDVLLKRIEEEKNEDRRFGRLKIFFGYAAGVGKTYAMLEAAHAAKDAGIDVVAGYIEPHTRPETLALLEGLEQLPPLKVDYKGISQNEFDLDGALRRRPQLILVDELAHTNVEGSRHKKRYQDIEELLRAGIDVYTTVNVQHIESLNDIVASITGVIVKERVPDSVFDHADQVELVDIEPDDLIERINQGKVYRNAQAEKALKNFFVPENLISLREIALRRSADRVSRRAEESAKHSDGQKHATEEHILICLSSSPSNAKVIRTASRMADAFHGTFTALYVKTSNVAEGDGEGSNRFKENMRLAEQLGAKIVTVYGEDVALQIAEYARVSGVSKVVIGRSNNKKGLFRQNKNLVERLTSIAPNLDIYIIPDTLPPFAGKRAERRQGFSISWTDVAKTIGILCLTSLVGMAFYMTGLRDSNIITVYILGVLFTSVVTTGRLYGAMASLLSVFVFNFLFTEPRFTFHVHDAGYPITFLVMFTASFVASSLTMRVKNQAKQEALKAYRTGVLLETSQKLQRVKDESEILTEVAGQLEKLLNCTIVFYPVEGDNLGKPVYFPKPDEANSQEYYISKDEMAVAAWVMKNNKHAGATTNTLPGAKCLYMAVRNHDVVLAVVGVAITDRTELQAYDKNLLVALLGECALALEKNQLGREKTLIEMKAQQEQLRANLLRAISHDLRTPLTSISGNAGILMGNSKVLDEEKKQRLYSDIYDDSMWLINLVENLLSVTRIENGTMDIKMEPELISEIIDEALSHINRKREEHHITVELRDDMLMAKMDSRLIVQVIINIVDNAIKYTPEGSDISISAFPKGKMIQVEVADNGEGIADEAKSRLFDMFYTADNSRGDGRRGLGLGLSLCKSIILAHGGRIGVRDNRPHGTIIYFTLQAEEVDYHEQTQNFSG